MTTVSGSPNKFAFLSEIKSIVIFGSALSVFLFFVSIVFVNRAAHKFDSAFVTNQELSQLADSVVYYDEVLTMSANMASATGETKWLERYQEIQIKLDAVLKRCEILLKSNFPEGMAILQPVNSSNNLLVEMENESFKLIDKALLTDAQRILNSEKYLEQKKIYSSHIRKLSKNINQFVNEKYASTHKEIDLLHVLSGLCIFSILGTWAAIFISNTKHLIKQNRIERQLCHAQKMEAIGALSGGVAHEINNKLTVISGFLELTKQNIEKNNTAKAFENIKKCNAAIDDGNKITRDLLTFSHEQPTDLCSHLLNKLVEDNVDIAKATILKSVDVERILPSYDLYIKCEPGEVGQILINLLNNAAHACSTANSKIIVKLGAVDNSHAIVEIIDNGVGISELELKQVMNPFFTTKEAGVGTGLGLYVVNNLMNKMHGEVVISSDKGKGTTVSLIFPIASAN